MDGNEIGDELARPDELAIRPPISTFFTPFRNNRYKIK